MRKGDSGCTVPVPREVRAGTLATILRQAGVQPGAFSAAVDWPRRYRRVIPA
jgi:hypothetical protein